MLGRSHVPASICLALLLLAGCGDRSKRVGSSEEVLAPQEISYQVLAPYFLDLPIIPLAPSIEGGSPTTWSCEPELTEGLTINGSSGVISGTPTIISPSTEYLITASNSAGTTTFLLTLSVIVQPPCALGYTDPSPIYQLGITIAPNLPFTSCGEATSWTVVPELPGGLFLDGGTGTISGIPGQLTAPTEHLVEAFNSTGSSQTIVTITVVDEPPCALTYPQNEMLLALGEVLPEQTPSVGCGEVEGYSVEPPLPAGLFLDPLTGVLSGVGAGLEPATLHLITAANGTGSSSFEVSIEVYSDPPCDLSYQTPVANYLVGVEITPNLATIGCGTATSFTIDPGLPEGLDLDPLLGTISGTPQSAVPPLVHTVTASNLSGQAIGHVIIQVLSQAPVADFSASPTSGENPLTVVFTDLSTGEVDNWNWDFGDGGTSSQQNPSHTYTTPGNYIVLLQVSGPGGSDLEICFGCVIVTDPPIPAAPIADFSLTPASGNHPLTVTFTDASTGEIDDWTWTFGDGGTSSEQNPSHIYTAAGTYIVLLEVAGPGGSDLEICFGCVTVTDLLPDPPIASFIATPVSGQRPLAVAFTDTSNGTVDNYAWTFGDGGTSTEENPSHTFTNPGTYTVTLTASNAGGSDTEICSACVMVADPPAPIAEFIAIPTSGDHPLTVAFTDASTGEIGSWNWTFGDGETSTDQNPSHTYTAAGTFIVLLEVTGPGGSDLEICFGCITVTDPLPEPPAASFTTSSTSGEKPLTVVFTDGSAGTVDSYAWTFGDGATSAAQNPSHTYTSAGIYTVTLTVGNAGGSDTEICSACITVADPPPPIAGFTATPSSGSSPLLVSFTDSSSGTVGSYAWTFGDGETSTDQNPVHTYAAEGTFTVVLQVSGPDGSDTAICFDCVTVTDPPLPEPPIAAFTLTPTSGVHPLTVAFTETSQGTVDSFAWTFGDGGTSSAQNPLHTYTTAGTFIVTLTVSNAGGGDTATCAACVTVDDPPPPVASFTATPTSGENPLTVAFTEASSGDIDSWNWNFGDGETSTEESPSHTYTSAGTFIVLLAVSGPGGSDTEICFGCVTVTDPPPPEPPIADFTVTSTSGESPLLVAFTDISTGSVDNFAWTFGDGGTSAVKNPLHTYTAAGTFTVTLTVSNSSGESSTATCPDCITVTDSPPPPPSSAFSATPTSGENPLTVAFTDASGGVIDSWNWTFGDGATSTDPNPSHTYTFGGSFTVVLQVTGAGGSDTAVCFHCVTVTDPPPPVPPIADFTATPTSGDHPLTVAFTETTLGTVDNFAWTFGDGGISSAPNPLHTYTTAGTYTVTLTVSNAGGSDTTTCTGCISVANPLPPQPVADFTATPASGENPLLVAFSDLSNGTVDSHAWTFGDGATSTAQNPSHTYTSAGTFTVVLQVTGPGGTDTAICFDCIVVTDPPPPPPPIAAFTATPTSGDHPLTVAFTETSQGTVNTFAWTFGDGGISSAPNPVHTYTAGGTYTVTLTVSNAGGSDTTTCIGCITATFPQSTEPPIAAFTATPTSGDHPMTVAFIDTSSGVVDNWSWDFGDGGTSSTPNPAYTYTAAGTYTVTLTVSNPSGSDTAICSGCITVADPPQPPPIAGFNTSSTSGEIPLLVAFTNVSSGTVDSYAWTFGDGATSPAQSPSHLYTTAGTYTVTLTASNAGGSDTAICSACITVVDPPAPIAGFSVNPISGDHPLTAVFTDTSSGEIDSWSWDFGDGSSSSLQSPSHTYTIAGTFNVLLEVSGPGGNDLAICFGCITVTDPLPEIPIAGFSATSTSGEVPLTIAFTDTSVGAIDSYAWTFGDGATSSAQNPSHLYTTAGTYTVTLTVNNAGGSDTAICSACITVVDPPAPIAGFTVNPISGDHPLTAVFNDTSTGEIDSWSWDFGDGSSSSLQSPSHTYTIAGTFNVLLEVSGPGGNDLAICFGCITVTDPLPEIPIAGFSATSTSGEVPLTIAFTDTSVGAIDSYAWTFGDGATSSAQNPSHLYTTAGTYTVTLTVSNAGGSDTATCAGCVTVTDPPPPPPIADFSAAPTSGEFPLLVTFTNSSSGTVDSYAWTFGDGGTSTDPNPTHTYTIPGIFTVVLQVSGPDGSDTTICFDCVTVFEPPPPPAPIADFATTPTSGENPLAVAFTDASLGVVDNYAWTFGDGGTSSVPNPTHTYMAAGIYTVTLTVNNAGGGDTATCVGCITVSDPPPPIAGFTATPTSGENPLPVVFTDSSSGDIDTWHWDFGDGGTSSLQNPPHTYAAAGAFIVLLTVSGPGGSDTEICFGCVTVTDPPPPEPPFADFTATSTSGENPLLVAFSDASTGTIDNYFWSFGDGGTSAAQNPTHTYTAAGSFTVTLTVSNSSGESSTATCPGCITVTDPLPPPPIADFTATPTSGDHPLPVAFADASSGVIDSWSWTFGDGETSTDPNPLHTYTFAGNFTVVLQLAGPGGNDTTICFDCVTVTNPPPPATPIASFTATPTSGENPLTVAFADESLGIVDSYAWDFGDGVTSSASNPSHTYTTAGTFTVTLTVSNAGGSDTTTCSACVSVTDPQPVAPPVGEFTATPTSGVYPLTVAFSDLSTGEIDSWNWDFGDGSTTTVQNPSHTYTTAGTFLVVLQVVGPGGSDLAICIDCITVTDPPPPIADFTATPTSGVNPLTVAFTDLSTGAVEDYSWDFGDGGTSLAQNPSHTYTSPGTFTVALTTSNSSGESSTVTCTSCITVADPPPPLPNADFALIPTSGETPLTVEFTDASTGEIDSWNWDFGDGSTSSAPSLSHTYTTAGTYTVTLTVSNVGGSDTATCSDCITVTDPPPPLPSANFSMTPTSGVIPLTVVFTDTSSGSVDSWSWDFGDGGTSSEQGPSHTYTTLGTYVVTLTVTGPGGSDMAVCIDCITVTPPPPPIADFIATPTSGENPLTVAFTDSSTGEIDSWSWDFGDGATSTSQHPSYTYTVAGTYAVTLLVTNAGGSDTATCAGCITVDDPPPPPPIADFSATPTSGLNPLTVAFSDASSGVIDSWNWDFGDGMTSTDQNPSHLYSEAGTFFVGLEVVGPGGSDTAICFDCISVTDPPPSSPCSLVYHLASVTLPVGTPIDSIIPTVACGTAISITISPNLPQGLSINPLTGSIEGTPVVDSPEVEYTIVVSNITDSAQAVIRIRIADVFHYWGDPISALYDPTTGEGVAETSIWLEEGSQNLSYPTPLAGVSFALQHDPSLLEGISAEPGAALTGLNGGSGPDFWVSNLLDGMVVAGVVVSFNFSEVLLVPGPSEVVRLSYTTTPGTLQGNLDGVQSTLTWGNPTGVPPIDNLVVSAGNIGVVPVFHDVPVTLAPSP